MSDTMLPRIVALCGARRTGKDTVASYLVEHHGYEHVKITAPLKRVCQTLFHFTEDQLETDSKELPDPRWGISPRQVMQFLGTEVFQYKIQELLPEVGRCFWINSLATLIRANPDKRYVISDMRFLHEHQVLQSIDPSSMRTIRVSSQRVAPSPADTHLSECEHHGIPADADLTNNGTKEDLYTTVDAALFGK